tara:strand:- start:4063 stop:4971 length:909 start_codon:yes stop_codon:yes gene_type:complete
MKVLICASGNAGRLSPFVQEQAESLEKLGIKIDYFLIIGNGILGYLKNYPLLIRKIKLGKYDLIHAHYGLSGLLATLQKRIPVIITFHGTDINNNKNIPFSLLASRLSQDNIFVHDSLPKKLKLSGKNFHIISCGVNLDIFSPMNKIIARDKLGWDEKKNYILFSSQFNNPIKNASLAKSALESIDLEIELIELKGYQKRDIRILMNAVDLLLVTSFSETGPIVVKEALACNCPIISTDIGDVKSIIQKIDNCFISSYNPIEIGKIIKQILASNLRSNGRGFMNSYRLDKIANKIKKVYENI